MEQQESQRQQKVARQIQKDMADILIKECADVVRGVMASVTTVRVSPDLGYARIYVSVFPFAESERIMKALEENNWRIRRSLGTRIRTQVRVVPELSFFLDDSLEYIQNIDNLLKK